MRRKGRVDANQGEITKALRNAGYSVTITSGIGNGFPDLVVGRWGRNHILEIKDGLKSPSAQALTRDEEDWHACWKGKALIVTSVQDALDQLRQEVFEE